jgi:hypothetical protein
MLVCCLVQTPSCTRRGITLADNAFLRINDLRCCEPYTRTAPNPLKVATSSGECGLRCNPSGFDVCSDRSGRDVSLDRCAVHFINISSFVGCGARESYGCDRVKPASRAQRADAKHA